MMTLIHEAASLEDRFDNKLFLKKNHIKDTIKCIEEQGKKACLKYMEAIRAKMP